ncbi:MAG: GDP-mannose 4,6-dehydratase [Bryobacteraceae bacterium]
MKKAVITGCTGQDGSYLVEFLLDRGYEVHGFRRRSSSFTTDRLVNVYRDQHDSDARFFLHYADLSDGGALANLIHDSRPEEVYNLGAQSHVMVSFEVPEYTADVVAVGVLKLLEAIRRSGVHCRFYQASSSEMFGNTFPPQSESTVFHPRSPYACAKLFGHNITVNYRESYGMHASSGILFNHESPRRGETFVTRKITRAVARIKYGLQPKLYLGNLDAKRDWGYAPDYVRAMWLMLQQDQPDDYVVGTGEAHSVREFLELAFEHAGLDWRQYVEIDPRFFRPAEVDFLLADAGKARKVLGWEPTVTFRELVQIMTDADIADVERRISGGIEALSHTKTAVPWRAG